MYRSASTLQFQIATHLVKAANIGEQVGWIDADRFAEVRAAYPDTPELLVIKVHKCTDAIAAEFIRDNARGIYTFRDIRDVYSSMMQQRQKTFECLWQENFLDTCLDNYKGWTMLPNVLISRYERIIEDVANEVRRIAAHLRIELPAEQADQIAASYSLEAQKARIAAFKQNLLQMRRDPNDHRELEDYHDENSLLHMNHINAVKTGRWQDDLTPEAATLIEAKVVDWCKEHGYEPDLFLSQQVPAYS
jgi:hypothetical protein